VAEVNFVDRKRDFDERVEKLLLAPATEDLQGVDWDEAEWLPLSFSDLREEPERVEANQGPFFAPVPERANTARELKSIGTDLSDWLYYNSRLPIAVHPELDIAQEPGESERAFKIRVKQAARERRDAEVDALKEKYATRIDKLEDKLRKKERELSSDEADHQSRKQEELLGAGETVFSMLGGRRRSLSRVASRRRMTRKAKLEMEETKEEIADIEEDITELEAELSEDVAEITEHWENAMDEVTTQELKPRRTDVDVQVVALAWVPSWLIGYKEGSRTRAVTAPAYSLSETS
jgi:phage host-nuclease inhibitor protein Gam